MATSRAAVLFCLLLGLTIAASRTHAEPLSNKTVHQQLFGSSAWVRASKATGTAWPLDREVRPLVTGAHVAVQPRAPSKALVELLGLRVNKPSAVLIEQLNLPKERGLLIEYVRPNSAAEKAGLRLHDILIEVDGKPVSSNVSEFPALLASFKPDTPVQAVIIRKGKQETIKALTRPADKGE